MEKNDNAGVSPKKQSKLKGFILKNKVTVFLLLVILGVFSWGSFKNYRLKAQFEKNKMEIEIRDAIRLDSIKSASYELSTKVFSWAIRSEMLRNNTEQVDQFFLSFIKEPNVRKIQLLNPDTGKVLLSTDKKEEGQVLSQLEGLKTDSLTAVRAEGSLKVYSPIMGLNTKLGLLIVEFEN